MNLESEIQNEGDLCWLLEAKMAYHGQGGYGGYGQAPPQQNYGYGQYSGHQQQGYRQAQPQGEFFHPVLMFTSHLHDPFFNSVPCVLLHSIFEIGNF